ncbi:MAG: imidazolonepropionase [Flavobacteriaceae bacterium]|nr:imidazolonepropionase [Flavobacteriaceae bacterium]
MGTLIYNIKELLQIREADISKISGADMQVLPRLKNAFLVIENGLIADFGPMANCPKKSDYKTIDAAGKFVLPTWCDSHTHLVYAANREDEFVDRIKGLSYEEIAQKGGGILNSAQKLAIADEKTLFKNAQQRLNEIISQGTGAVEIKSGYGLNTEAELKMLRIIKRLKQESNIPIKATFLGAHAIPLQYKNNSNAYVDEIINDMLPKIAQENLADYIDVFCETGYFTVAQTDRILKAAKKYNLIPKIHVNQFTSIGGVQVGIANDALSLDHLEILTNADLDSLKSSKTMPVALPGCSFFLSIPYTPARRIIDAGLPLALASDFNPGSTPSGNMNFVVATACIKMNMTPEEAINAATLNGAHAMGLSKQMGSITKGKKANLIITKKISSLNYIPYAFGSNLIDTVFINDNVHRTLMTLI